MCMWRAILAGRTERRSVCPEGRQDTAFRSDIQPAQRCIPGEYVRTVADIMRSNDAHGGEIQHEQLCISFARHEQQPTWLVERETVRMLRAWQIIAAHDL